MQISQRENSIRHSRLPQRGSAVQVALSTLTLLVASLNSPVHAQAPAAPVEPMKNVVEPGPDKPPAWLAGYQLKYTLRMLGDPPSWKSQSVVARIPTGTWLRADGADVAVLAADGTPVPVAILSHSTMGETLIQFPRHGLDPWYYVFAGNPAAPAAANPPLPEGVVLEVRNWSGDLGSWTTVRDSLAKADVIANAFVPNVMQTFNPARPDVPKNYAVTYRGNLLIPKDGVYRFFVNSEDASFLFIDGFKVCDRPGSNPRITGAVPTKTFGKEVELKAGLHPFEVSHALAESPTSNGLCLLLWLPPGATGWTIAPREVFSQPDLALVSSFEAVGPSNVASIEYGIEDTLVAAGGTTIFLTQFAANGDLPADDKALVWDFGDGTKGTGRSVRHVYFSPGDYKVTLTCGGSSLPPYQRRVLVWAAPGDISPFSISHVIQTLAGTDWKTLPVERQDPIFDFLTTSDHPDRWPLIAGLVKHRLTQTGLDPQYRAQLYRSLIEALGHSAGLKELQPVMEQALKEFAKLATLQVGVELAVATVYHRQLRDLDEAGKRYEALLEKHRRLEHPDLRVAAIRWGDLLAEAGDLKKAGDLYRTAATLGGDAFQTSAQSDAVTRGALLRVAEQKLRTGDIHETRQLLDKIELNYPEQKLEGLYRFLRAESDRFAGRYEDALRNYEVLLKLRQWSGYRDKTIHGVADCYIRMDDVPQAKKWLEELQTRHAAYFEKQKLADQLKLINERQSKVAKSGAAGQPGRPPKFREFFTSFEPEEPGHLGKPDNFKLVPGLGLPGKYVGALESYPVYRGYLTYNCYIPDLTPSGHYWVELWYREDLLDPIPGFGPHFRLYVLGAMNIQHPTRGQGTYYIDRSPGAWRRVGFPLEAPLSQEGRAVINALTSCGLQIDSISVRAVTDRDLDALGNFIAGEPDEGGE